MLALVEWEGEGVRLLHLHPLGVALGEREGLVQGEGEGECDSVGEGVPEAQAQAQAGTGGAPYPHGLFCLVHSGRCSAAAAFRPWRCPCP